ncbi:uncharacterized protein (UPF0261 family) [Tamaricihabitans halophyticus]|uniref:Uncharacterized protein (UPF0261 family) n=1 Tax=Tamaricihabitans halophyticus TaxID=1262583 RepID=A0A4R2QDP0_9PSEU|nr:Tm-1-like ATP-binding domain-containing protein [Tamaricihabitans halophyticus]TCP45121.1 uncharacterized protein (UPF0261 family) [Tamaricihabitans halophyticus]
MTASMAKVLLVGTLDTKRDEYLWLRARLRELGCAVTVLDVGSYSDGAGIADYPPVEVARAAGADLDALRSANDRGAALVAMAEGAAKLARQRYDAAEVDAVLAVGGSGGSSIAGRVFQALPIGLPKLLVSTMASGDVRPYVGSVDVTLMYSVVDISGINSISEQILGNAVAATAGMAKRFASARGDTSTDRPVIAASMFGLTTPAVDEARSYLTELGYEVLVFHATGTGGRALEALAASGLLAGVLDLTTTELADELVGGVLSAGPTRLEAAGARGIPQVVSLGALDMVNFGPRESVPEVFAGRQFLVHNPTVTLMRSTAEELAELGRIIAGKLVAARGPVEVFLPLRGLSGIDCAGGPFADPAADQACFEALRAGLAGSAVTVHARESAINDPGFGRAAAQALHAQITRASSVD